MGAKYTAVIQKHRRVMGNEAPKEDGGDECRDAEYEYEEESNCEA